MKCFLFQYVGVGYFNVPNKQKFCTEFFLSQEYGQSLGILHLCNHFGYVVMWSSC